MVPHAAIWIPVGSLSPSWRHRRARRSVAATVAAPSRCASPVEAARTCAARSSTEGTGSGRSSPVNLILCWRKRVAESTCSLASAGNPLPAALPSNSRASADAAAWLRLRLRSCFGSAAVRVELAEGDAKKSSSAGKAAAGEAEVDAIGALFCTRR